MLAATLSRLSVAYASESVFSEIDWEIADDRVVGLVGENGSGKSSLLKAIAGVVDPSAGTVARRVGLTVGHLPQELSFPEGSTPYQVVRAGAAELGKIEGALAEAERRLACPEVYEDADALARVLNEQEALLDAYERAGGPGLDARLRGLLGALGFAGADLDRPMATRSGGERKLVGLAAQAIRAPDLLLLDEPDNHLDLEGKAYLARFVRDYKGGVILVSHDRYLLDLVVDEIVELEAGRLTRFPGNYSEYVVAKEHQRARQQQRFADQQKEITRLENSAKRLSTWARLYDNPKFAKRAQAIYARLDRMERVEAPPTPRRTEIELPGWRGSSKVLELEAVSKVFPADAEGDAATVVLRRIDLLVRHGERVGVVGRNGAGKTVLLRILLGEEQPTTGSVVIGPSVRIGYYAQRHETLDPERSLIEILRYDSGRSTAAVMPTLARFGFGYDQAHRPVQELSGGERSRLQLARIMLSGANLLLLDEPTNHLDIASAERLEDALEGFEGTVLTVSHDRYFLDRVASRIAALEDGTIAVHTGGYSDYAARTGERFDRRAGEIR